MEALSPPAGTVVPGCHVSRYLACGEEVCRGGKGEKSDSLPQIPPHVLGPIAGLWPWLLMCPLLGWDSSPALKPSTACLPLPASFPRGYFLSLVPLVLAWNTAQPWQMTQNCNAVTWSGFCLFFLCWQPFYPGPTHQTRGPSWSQCHPGSGRTLLGSPSTVILIVGHCPQGSAFQPFCNQVFWELLSGLFAFSTLGCLEARGHQMSHFHCRQSWGV